MLDTNLEQNALRHLEMLCRTISNRCVGSDGNEQAVTYFEKVLSGYGFQTHTQDFPCMDWSDHGAELEINGRTWQVQSSPFTLGCDLIGSLIPISTVSDLEKPSSGSEILLLHGEIARETLFPRNFAFMTLDEQQRIYRALDARNPAGMICATARNPGMTGAVYPAPLFEDGDLDIPSVFLSAEDGDELLRYAGENARLTIHAERKPAKGRNCTGIMGAAEHRLLFCAHIDAKKGSPGAVDNAAGIVTLLLLAESLRDYNGKTAVEITAINGEDYYSNPGEQVLLRQNAGVFDKIRVAINLDGLGFRGYRTAYSLYDCDERTAERVRKVFASDAMFMVGDPWYQGDHSIFLLHQRPAIAITSEGIIELTQSIIHTERDTIEIIDPNILTATSQKLADLVSLME